MAEESAPEQLTTENAAQTLSGESLEALRRADLGPFGFSRAISDLEVIGELTRAFSAEDAAFLPDNFEVQVQTQLNEVDTQLRRMREFDPETEDAPAQVRDEIETQVASARHWFALTVKPQLRAGALEWSTLATEARAATQQAREASDEAVGLLSDLRARAGETVAEQLSDYYRVQAKNYGAEATRNFRLTLGALVALIGSVALAFWVWPIELDADDSTSSWEDLLRGLAPRLLVLGLVAYALSFFSRNYRTARHLQAVNEHKRNALDTYGLFVSTVTDAQRDLITAELVRRVFENPDTGWISHSGNDTVIEAPTILGAMRPPPAA